MSMRGHQFLTDELEQQLVRDYETTNETIQSLATKYGFRDPSAISRIVKKWNGKLRNPNVNATYG